jgi:uncharacterized protein YbbC (DUF1343 family)
MASYGDGFKPKWGVRDVGARAFTFIICLILDHNPSALNAVEYDLNMAEAPDPCCNAASVNSPLLHHRCGDYHQSAGRTTVGRGLFFLAAYSIIEKTD